MHVKREACERTKPTCAADISKKQIFTGIYTKIATVQTGQRAQYLG
jgi:hypothetical protein